MAFSATIWRQLAPRSDDTQDQPEVLCPPQTSLQSLDHMSLGQWNKLTFPTQRWREAAIPGGPGLKLARWLAAPGRPRGLVQSPSNTWPLLSESTVGLPLFLRCKITRSSGPGQLLCVQAVFLSLREKKATGRRRCLLGSNLLSAAF